MFKKTVIALGAVSMLAACATPPKDISPTYVSTNLYQGLSCEQLREEAQGVSNRAVAAYGAQKQNVTQDAAMTGVGVVLFWPALFFMQGNGAEAAAVGQVKGEMAAIEQVNRVKNCGIQFAPMA
jgi:hypothetical protein